MSSSEPHKRIPFSSNPISQIGCVSPDSERIVPIFHLRHRICQFGWLREQGVQRIALPSVGWKTGVAIVEQIFRM